MLRNALLVAVAVLCGVPVVDGQEIDFDRDIRPILSDNCSQCHGPDESTREADLRLDVKESAFANRGSGPAFLAGNPAESEALRRIFSDDVDQQMPPPASKLRLSGRQKERLRQWVEEGAAWSEHWAFVSPQGVTPPQVKNAEWIRNGIDPFVVRRLAGAGLQPYISLDIYIYSLWAISCWLFRIGCSLSDVPYWLFPLWGFLPCVDASFHFRGYQVDNVIFSRPPHSGQKTSTIAAWQICGSW